LWKFETVDGRGIRKAMEFLYPYLADKSKWPRKPDGSLAMFTHKLDLDDLMRQREA
jgi:hypothetical protein